MITEDKQGHQLSSAALFSMQIVENNTTKPICDFQSRRTDLVSSLSSWTGRPDDSGYSLEGREVRLEDVDHVHESDDDF